METDVPQVEMVAARVGDHHSARVQGSGQASTWQADTGRGQVRGGGQTHRTDANLRVGKRDHVVGGVHFQTPFLHCSRVRARSLCVCVCASAHPHVRETLIAYVLFMRCVVRLLCIL